MLSAQSVLLCAKHTKQLWVGRCRHAGRGLALLQARLPGLPLQRSHFVCLAPAVLKHVLYAGLLCMLWLLWQPGLGPFRRLRRCTLQREGGRVRLGCSSERRGGGPWKRFRA